jgi:hypothetical protein
MPREGRLRHRRARIDHVDAPFSRDRPPVRGMGRRREVKAPLAWGVEPYLGISEHQEKSCLQQDIPQHIPDAAGNVAGGCQHRGRLTLRTSKEILTSLADHGESVLNAFNLQSQFQNPSRNISSTPGLNPI